MLNSAIWNGRSGNAYTFKAHPLDGPLDDQRGIYIFARQNSKGDGWIAICIGESDSFSRELPAHPKRQCGRNHAATHLHVLAEEDEAARRSAVRGPDRPLAPPCNQTLVDAPSASREHVVAIG